MIRSLLAVTPYRPHTDCVHSPWLAVAPATVDGFLVGVSVRVGGWAVMLDLPRRIDLALALRDCCCDEADVED